MVCFEDETGGGSLVVCGAKVGVEEDEILFMLLCCLLVCTRVCCDV